MIKMESSSWVRENEYRLFQWQKVSPHSV
ncbi:MAG: hypothetical protein DMG61_05000 [Acidobacteria bacterium]|nr:MAG: hypothetical protein DMG61_05000 [Acidobacteriota bacterium]